MQDINIFFRIIEIIFGSDIGPTKAVRVIMDHHHTITKDRADSMIDQLVKVLIHVIILQIHGSLIVPVARTLLKMNGTHWEIDVNDQLLDHIHMNNDHSKFSFHR